MLTRALRQDVRQDVRLSKDEGWKVCNTNATPVGPTEETECNASATTFLASYLLFEIGESR